MLKQFYLIICTFILFNSTILADTHYVSTTGTDSGDCTNQANACLTINYGISKMSGGDTLEIGDGTYSGAENNLDKNSNIPVGSDGNYTIIKAKNIDSSTSHVTITSNFNFSVGSSEASKEIHHVEFHGLKIKSSVSKNISGHHIKVFKTAFEGGPVTNNTVVFSVGHNNLATHSNNILLEDIWSYGLGGRYNVMVYNSENVIIRRAIIRHDGGWGCDGSNPEAGMTIYNSRFVQLQNVIVLDGISDKNTTGGKCQGFTGFYNVSNGSGSTQHENTRIVGSISMNNSATVGMAWDDYNSIPNALLENSFIYNNNGKGINANGTFKDVTVKNVTIVGNAGHGIAKYGTDNSFKISNTLIYNNSGDALKNTGAIENVLCYNNTSTSGCHIKNVDPINSGLVYLPRIETGSYLESAGTGSTRIGANIVSRTGVSGTLYGETNFDTEQDALWPWPNEDRIASDLCAVRNVGFCSTNITDYVWSALGNATPVNLQPMPTPTGVKALKN